VTRRDGRLPEQQPTRWWLVAGSVVVVAAALWLLLADPGTTGARSSGQQAAVALSDDQPSAVEENQSATGPDQAGAPMPRLDSRADLAGILASRDLDADRLIEAWQTWRVARGFLGDNPLTGVTRERSLVDTYARLDDLTLAQMAEAGELGALQEQAARLEGVDSIGAVGKYQAAAQRGSAEAMFGASRALLGVAALQAEDTSADPELTATLQEWRNMDGSTDIRQEALAWALAAVRTDGAAVLDGSRLAQIENLARELDEDQLRMACAESLAYFGGYRGLSGGTGIRRGVPPPVFISAPGIYERLPCGDTAAPITPPQPMKKCQVTPVQDGSGRRQDLWICPEN